MESMPSWPGAGKDSAAGLSPTIPGWVVTEVEAVDDWRLAVAFFDGTKGTVEMKGLVFGPKAGVFAALRDPELFRQAHIFMDAVTWPGEIDLAPDAMHAAIRREGVWRPA